MKHTIELPPTPDIKAPGLMHTWEPDPRNSLVVDYQMKVLDAGNVLGDSEWRAFVEESNRLRFRYLMPPIVAVAVDNGLRELEPLRDRRPPQLQPLTTGSYAFSQEREEMIAEFVDDYLGVAAEDEPMARSEGEDFAGATLPADAIGALFNLSGHDFNIVLSPAIGATIRADDYLIPVHHHPEDESRVLVGKITRLTPFGGAIVETLLGVADRVQDKPQHWR